MGDFVLPALAVAVVGAVLASERIVKRVETPGPVQIEYWEKWTGFEGDAMRKVVDDFNASQNRIHVNLLTVSDIANKVMLATSAGIPPDVAGLYSGNLAQYVDDRAATPLDEYCRRDGIGPEDYKPVYWDSGFYRGHVYSLPSTPATTALHYNSEMLRKAGFDPNRPPQTIEELSAMADKLTVKENGKIKIAGFLPSEPGWWNWCWGYFFGGKLWDGDKITINSPENIRGYEWVQSFPKKYGPQAVQTFKSGFGNFSSPQNAFMSDQVATELQGVWMYNFITQFAPKMDWKAVPFPYPKDRPDLKGVTIAEADILIIPRGAKHPEEAWEFIKYVNSQKGMETLCMGQRKNSPLTKVSQAFLDAHPNPYIELFDSQAANKNAIGTPKIGIWAEYQAEINNAFDEIMLLRKTPKQALDDVAKRMQPKMDQYLRRLKARDAAEASK